MLGKLFGRKQSARRGQDHIWIKDADRHAGILREAERAAAEGASVVVVALTATLVDELAAGLGSHAPAICKDVFGQGVLRGRLAQAKAVTVALATALPKLAAGSSGAGPSASGSVPVEILVFGRHDRRDSDDEIVAFADASGPRARVTFHLSFDDPLLARFAGGAAMKELLGKLGLREGEAVAHAMVTRAIERAQQSG